MKPYDHAEHKQHAFDSFCKKILKNEARNFYDEMRRLREREVSFSELSQQEMEQLFMVDEYPSEQHQFNVLGYDIAVKSEVLAVALSVLPELKRDIILLYHFIGMTDKEIGESLDIVRQTVQYQRTSSLTQLKKIMEEFANGKND